MFIAIYVTQNASCIQYPTFYTWQFSEKRGYVFVRKRQNKFSTSERAHAKRHKSNSDNKNNMSVSARSGA